jgi:hypothetical protein
VNPSGGEKTYGQHLDAAGNETWAANGIVLQETSSSGWDIDTNPQICRDGAGGMYLVQTEQHVFAQRIDISGTSQWGSNGIVAAATSDQTESFSTACIDVDGYGSLTETLLSSDGDCADPKITVNHIEGGEYVPVWTMGE